MKTIEELIDPLHLEDLQNELHPSVFSDDDEYNILIIQLPIISKTKLKTISTGFIFTKENSFCYNRKKNSLEKLEDIFASPYEMINKQVDMLLKSFIQYQENIVDMEEILYTGATKQKFLHDWLEQKLEILKIERILLRSTNALNEFIDFHENQENFPYNEYLDIHEHLERTMRSATLQLSKLDSLYSFYSARANDNMNKMIYILTIISAIFLPLNLIVGFFGMNTGGLPFHNHSSGTVLAASLMIISLVLTTLIIFKWQNRMEK